MHIMKNYFFWHLDLFVFYTEVLSKTTCIIFNVTGKVRTFQIDIFNQDPLI